MTISAQPKSGRTIEKGFNPALTLAVVVSATFAYKGIETILSPVLPLVQESLHASEAEIGWVLTGVLLTGSVATPLIGRLGDVRNKKSVLLAVLAMVAIGTAVSGLSTSVLMLTIGQLLQGIGLGVIPLAFGIIRATQNEARIKSGNGAVIGFIYAGTGIAIIGSGAIVSVLPWRWLFSVPFAIVVIILIAAWRFIPSLPPTKQGRVDYGGAALLGSSLAVILIGITNVPEWGWISLEFGAALASCVVLLAAFVFVELRTSEPLIDVRLLATRPIAISCLSYLQYGFAVNAVFLLVPMLVQQPVSTGYGFGASELTTSFLLLPLGVVGAVVAPLTGWLENRIGGRATMVFGVLMGTACFVMLFIANGNILFVLASTTLIGAAGAVTLTQAMNTVALTSPVSRIGAFSGLAFVVKAVGGTLGVQIAASILTTGAESSAPAWSSFTTAFWVGIALTGAVALSCLLLPRVNKAAEPVIDAKVSAD